MSILALFDREESGGRNKASGNASFVPHAVTPVLRVVYSCTAVGESPAGVRIYDMMWSTSLYYGLRSASGSGPIVEAGRMVSGRAEGRRGSWVGELWPCLVGEALHPWLRRDSRDSNHSIDSNHTREG
jgi:hypothetical protein